MCRTTIRPGAGKRRVDGKSLRLADEVRYIQRRAADRDGRVVTVGQLVVFSTETGDAWLLRRSARASFCQSKNWNAPEHGLHWFQ
jgi:hypothetical protein